MKNIVFLLLFLIYCREVASENEEMCHVNKTIKLKYFKLYKEVETVEKCRDKCQNKDKCDFFRYKVGIDKWFYRDN